MPRRPPQNPTTPQPSVPFGFTTNPDHAIQFVTLCHRTGRSRAEALRGLVQQAIEQDSIPAYTADVDITVDALEPAEPAETGASDEEAERAPAAA